MEENKEINYCQSCCMPMVNKEDFGTNKDGSKNDDYCIYCYKDGIKINYCQSCCMPMTNKEDFGINKDGSKNDDYCIYCYKDGKFTFDGTMEEMIEICIPPMVQYNKDMSEESARQCMKETFPKLKRWQNA